MFNLVTINLDKKLSFVSVVFMLLSLIVTHMIIIFNASFDVSDFNLYNEFDLFQENYILETIQLIELIEVIFIILLVELELFHNTDNFDSYFVSIYRKKMFFVSKIISYLIIIFFYTTVIFIQFSVVYLLRFQTIQHVNLLLNLYLNYLIYFSVIFLVAFLFMLIFKNYFSAMIVFLYYWIGKLIEENNELFNVIFPQISFDFSTNKSTFGTEILYILTLIVVMFFISSKIFEFKDMKVNS